MFAMLAFLSLLKDGYDVAICNFFDIRV